MTCDPLAYLQAAQKISAVATEEASYRATVSRAYYAAYHCCRLYYASLPQLSTLMGNGMHEQLINALTFPSKKLTSNGKARSEALGKYLRDMCQARVHADYRPDDALAKEKMDDAIGTAEMIFEFASVTKGPVEASVSPLAQA